jgi:hypothetical protein
MSLLKLFEKWLISIILVSDQSKVVIRKDYTSKWEQRSRLHVEESSARLWNSQEKTKTQKKLP